MTASRHWTIVNRLSEHAGEEGNMNIGIVHPGQMGITLAAALLASGHQVVWASAGRSQATKGRADVIGLQDALDSPRLAQQCDAIISVCPPGAATAVANEFAALAFSGYYLDANALAPSTAASIAQLFGAKYVDGGIIGPPAVTADTTRLYLSGDNAQLAAAWFSQGALQAVAIDKPGCAASALKMAYASYTKGQGALLLASMALAQANGVERWLEQEFELSQPGVKRRAQAAAQGIAPKAWRFAPEMLEIAATYTASEMPAGFHEAAAEIYQRMAGLKHAEDADLAAVLAAILDQEPTRAQP